MTTVFDFISFVGVILVGHLSSKLVASTSEIASHSVTDIFGPVVRQFIGSIFFLRHLFQFTGDVLDLGNHCFDLLFIQSLIH